MWSGMVGDLPEVEIRWCISFSTPTIHLRRRQGLALPENSAASPAKLCVCAVLRISGIPSCSIQIRTGSTVINALEPELSKHRHYTHQPRRSLQTPLRLLNYP